jgi:hypothetical protein
VCVCVCVCVCVRQQHITAFIESDDTGNDA